MVRKKNGFKNFMRKLDGVPNIPRVDTSGFWFKGSKRNADHSLALERILKGEHQYLMAAFPWTGTPHGVIYWSERCSRHSYLSQEDYAYIQYLIDNHT